MRVLAITISSSGGDWPPTLDMALALHERGHEVHVLGDRPILDALAGTGVKRIEWPEELAFQRFSQAAKNAAPDELFSGVFRAWAAASKGFGVDTVARTGADVLLSQLFCLVPVSTYAEETGVPWVFLNPAYYIGPDPARPMSQDWEMAAAFERAWLQPIMQADLVLHATDPTFDVVPTDLPPNHHYIGPLLWSPEGDAPTYLTDRGRPWSLVSLSNAPMPGEADLATAAVQALIEHDLRILVTGAGAEEAMADFGPHPLVHVEPFAPHDPVLDRAAVFVSHGGHGGVMRAMRHGVPMVIVPWGRDQPGVAFRAERLQVAEVVSRAKFSKIRVAQAIHNALTDPVIQVACRRTADRLRGTDPRAEGVRHIEALVAARQS